MDFCVNRKPFFCSARKMVCETLKWFSVWVVVNRSYWMPICWNKLEEAVVIFLVDFFDRLAFLVRRDGDRRAVRIGAGDHQHVVAFQAVVAGDDVTGQVRTGDVADVDLGIGVRPGDGDQDVFRHKDLILYALSGLFSISESAPRSI